MFGGIRNNRCSYNLNMRARLEKEMVMRIEKDNYIQQLRLHNEKALMYVIDEYGGLIMAVIQKHLFYLPERQEECFDDVLLKIWQNISEFDERKNTFKNWAAAIAKYRSIDYLRQYRREPAAVDIEDTVIAWEDQALAEVMEDEISREMEKMLSCLKPSDRELFMRLYVQEQTMEQISQDTGIKKEVIYNRVSRGKKKIRRQYGAEKRVV